MISSEIDLAHTTWIRTQYTQFYYCTIVYPSPLPHSHEFNKKVKTRKDLVEKQSAGFLFYDILGEASGSSENYSSLVVSTRSLKTSTTRRDHDVF